MQRIQTRHNPIDTASLAIKSTEPLNHPWFVADAPPMIVAAGRLSPEKDFPTLIRAFALLRAQRPLRLAILGEGEQRQALEAQISELPRSEEHTSELQSLMRIAYAVFCLKKNKRKIHKKA